MCREPDHPQRTGRVAAGPHHRVAHESSLYVSPTIISLCSTPCTCARQNVQAGWNRPRQHLQTTDVTYSLQGRWCQHRFARPFRQIHAGGFSGFVGQPPLPEISRDSTQRGRWGLESRGWEILLTDDGCCRGGKHKEGEKQPPPPQRHHAVFPRGSSSTRGAKYGRQQKAKSRVSI